MVEKKKACKECGGLTLGKECEICKSKDLVDKYKGTVVIFDAKTSEVAKRLNIEKEGSYALKY